MSYKFLYSLAFFLAIAVLCVNSINLVHAESPAFVDNGSIIQNVYGCGSLTTAGATYNLNQSIECNGTAITISASNIVFNGQGYTINYSTSGVASQNAITGTSRVNITLINFIINDGNLTTVAATRSAFGFIRLNNSLIYNNTAVVIGGSGRGISLNSNSYFNNISNNYLSTTSGSALYFGSSGHNFIAYNFANSTSGNGIFSDSGGVNNTILYNIGISNSSYGIYLLTSSNNTLIGNNGSSTSDVGIYLKTSSNYNNLTNNIGTTAANNNGIAVDGASYNWLFGNIGLSSSGAGIKILSAAQNNTLTNNNGTSTSGVGIYLLTNANGNVLTGNRGVSGSSAGIRLDASSNNILTSNTGISTSSLSCYINLVSNNNVFNSNNCTSGTSIGIQVTSSSNNTFNGNRGTGNGISNSFGSYFSVADENNTFINNILTSANSYAGYIKQSTSNIFSNNSYTSGTGFASVGIENSSGNSWTNIRPGFSVKGLVNWTENNFSITKGLIWNSTSIKDGLTGNIDTNTGTFAIPIQVNSVVYVANYFNVTEGSTIANSPIVMTSADLFSKSFTSSLAQLVNVTTIFNVMDCDSMGDIAYKSGTFGFNYPKRTIVCSNNQGRLVLTELGSSGSLNLNYSCSTVTQTGYNIILLMGALALVSFVIFMMYRNGVLEELTVGQIILIAIGIIVGVILFMASGDNLAVGCTP